MNILFNYINENISEEIRLDDLVSLTQMDRFQFLRSFKRRYKTTPIRLIWKIRIDLAGEVMKMNPHMEVIDVAFLCGFKSQSHFARAFKAEYNLTATEFKEEILSTNLYFKMNPIDINEFITSPRYPFTDYTIRNRL